MIQYLPSRDKKDFFFTDFLLQGKNILFKKQDFF